MGQDLKQIDRKPNEKSYTSTVEPNWLIFGEDHNYIRASCY